MNAMVKSALKSVETEQIINIWENTPWNVLGVSQVCF